MPLLKKLPAFPKRISCKHRIGGEERGGEGREEKRKKGDESEVKERKDGARDREDLRADG